MEQVGSTSRSIFQSPLKGFSAHLPSTVSKEKVVMPLLKEFRSESPKEGKSAKAGKNDKLVGKRVSVYWPKYEKWYPGKVACVGIFGRTQ